MLPGFRPIISIGYKYNMRKVISFIVTDNAGSTEARIPYYLTILTSFLMFSFILLLVPFYCISSLGMLMRLTATKNQSIMIWCWRSSGLLSVVGYCYLRQYLREVLLLISGK